MGWDGVAFTKARELEDAEKTLASGKLVNYLVMNGREAVMRGPSVWLTVKWSTAAELVGAVPHHLLCLVAVALDLAACPDARVHIITFWWKALRHCTVKASLPKRVCTKTTWNNSMPQL